MRTMRLYKSYTFKDKDPIIDRMRTIFEDAGISRNKLSVLSGVSSSTFHGWFDGKVKRPQFAPLMATARALGYDIQIVPGSARVATNSTVRFQRRRVPDAPSQPAHH